MGRPLAPSESLVKSSERCLPSTSLETFFCLQWTHNTDTHWKIFPFGKNNAVVFLLTPALSVIFIYFLLLFKYMFMLLLNLKTNEFVLEQIYHWRKKKLDNFMCKIADRQNLRVHNQFHLFHNVSQQRRGLLLLLKRCRWTREWTVNVHCKKSM